MVQIPITMGINPIVDTTQRLQLQGDSDQLLFCSMENFDLFNIEFSYFEINQNSITLRNNTQYSIHFPNFNSKLCIRGTSEVKTYHS